jgi:hypothetical protein
VSLDYAQFLFYLCADEHFMYACIVVSDYYFVTVLASNQTPVLCQLDDVYVSAGTFLFCFNCFLFDIFSLSCPTREDCTLRLALICDATVKIKRRNESPAVRKWLCREC